MKKSFKQYLKEDRTIDEIYAIAKEQGLEVKTDGNLVSVDNKSFTNASYVLQDMKNKYYSDDDFDESGLKQEIFKK